MKRMVKAVLKSVFFAAMAIAIATGMVTGSVIVAAEYPALFAVPLVASSVVAVGLMLRDVFSACADTLYLAFNEPRTRVEEEAVMARLEQLEKEAN